MLRRAPLPKALLAVLLAALLVAGCGGSDSNSVSQQELEAARVAGEEAAAERARVDRLEREVRSLRRAAARSAGDDDAASAPAAARAVAEEVISSVAGAEFHTPSGNVSCRISEDEALCAVASIDTTFVLAGGVAARTEPGTALAPGSGDLVPYGSRIATGPVTCSVPEADEQRGVSCVDTASGHGFEASRVPSRQKTY